MKDKLLIPLLLILSITANAQSADSAYIKFEKNKHDFGDIIQGTRVENVFSFINAGKIPLLISNVITTCGCTAPTWPHEAVPPKGKGEIKITFDSRGKMGMQNKVITIMSNASGSPHRITITANVIPK